MGLAYLGAYPADLPYADPNNMGPFYLALAHDLQTDPVAQADFRASGVDPASYAQQLIAKWGTAATPAPAAAWRLQSPGPAGSPVIGMASSEPVQGNYTLGSIFISPSGESWAVSRSGQGVGYLVRGTTGVDNYVPGPPLPRLPQVGDTFHLHGYSINIQQVGTAGTGLDVDEGSNLPIGTIYKITSGAGINETWQVVARNAAKQLGTAGVVPPIPVLPPPPPGSGSITTPPGATAGTVIQPGQTWHYAGYAIVIQSVGSGPLTGLQTDEGFILPLGTVYVDTVDNSVWQTTGPNTATQISTVTAPPTPVDASVPPATTAAPSSGLPWWAWAGIIGGGAYLATRK